MDGQFQHSTFSPKLILKALIGWLDTPERMSQLDQRDACHHH